MIFGIGTDIVAYDRIESLHEKYGESFARRILSPQELTEFHSHSQPARLLMKRFAAKEALAKAAGCGLRHPLTMKSVGVKHDALGKPEFFFDTELAAYLSGLGVTHHHLSISDEHEHAVAFVVLENNT
jgi:holo-[acyl-carrier protein] synthase